MKSIDDNNEYGDSDFLADRDKTIQAFRASDKETKHKIIEKMLTLRHNMKYNKHLLSVYTRAKDLFDTMVDEHRLQLDHLDEIYRHLNHIIRENHSSHSSSKMMMTELMKDKKRIGALLKKMRGSYDKLMDIDTIIGTTIENINEITFMDDHTETTADKEDTESNGDDAQVDNDTESDDDDDDTESDDDAESEDEDDTESDEDEEDDTESDEDDAESEDEDDVESEDEEEDEDDVESEDEDDAESDDEEEDEEDDAESEEDAESKDDGLIYVF
jgi:hypothetical protein